MNSIVDTSVVPFVKCRHVKPLPGILICLVLITVFTALPAFSQDAKRQLHPVAEDIFRWQNNFHFGLVVDAGESWIVVDPINAGAADWLKTELSARDDKPVSHLIYSHSHLDHASGGTALADGATVIAQANAPDDIDGVVPTQRFADQLVFDVGNKSFELTYLGPGHGVDLIAVVVRPGDVAFITDAASPQRLPYQDFGSSDINGWIDQIKKMETLDFEIFAPAHGRLGVKSDVADARQYIETLKAEVQKGLDAGKSSEELVAEITLDEYQSWQQYEAWRGLNIQGMYRYLKSQ